MFNNIGQFSLQVFFFYWEFPLSVTPIVIPTSMNQRPLKVLHVTWGSLLFWLSWLLSAADLTPGTVLSSVPFLPLLLRQRSALTATQPFLGFPCSEPSTTNSFSTLQPRWLFRRPSLTVQDFSGERVFFCCFRVFRAQSSSGVVQGSFLWLGLALGGTLASLWVVQDEFQLSPLASS